MARKSCKYGRLARPIPGRRCKLKPKSKRPARKARRAPRRARGIVGWLKNLF